mmetsp:Transcript_24829/g.54521  ORF Transcript_24829/g.54521 Transcript_24829/m.54521 type:complete len:311 (-) Transcript_24829:1928-2860(-)
MLLQGIRQIVGVLFGLEFFLGLGVGAEGGVALVVGRKPALVGVVINIVVLVGRIHVLPGLRENIVRNADRVPKRVRQEQILRVAQVFEQKGPAGNARQRHASVGWLVVVFVIATLFVAVFDPDMDDHRVQGGIQVVRGAPAAAATTTITSTDIPGATPKDDLDGFVQKVVPHDVVGNGIVAVFLAILVVAPGVADHEHHGGRKGLLAFEPRVDVGQGFPQMFGPRVEIGRAHVRPRFSHRLPVANVLVPRFFPVVPVIQKELVVLAYDPGGHQFERQDRSQRVAVAQIVDAFFARGGGGGWIARARPTAV